MMSFQWECNTAAPDGAEQSVLFVASVELFPFRDEPEIRNGELLELATGEGTKVLFVGCSFTTGVMD
jgi:hypothetical protein